MVPSICPFELDFSMSLVLKSDGAAGLSSDFLLVFNSVWFNFSEI